jgi:hypothetical protein
LPKRLSRSFDYPEVSKKNLESHGFQAKFEQKLRDNISIDVMPKHAIIPIGISLKTILEELQYGRNIFIRPH